MLTWNLATHIPIEENVLWENLAHDVLGENVHPGRKKGFILSRKALQDCLAQRQISLPISNLIINEYDHIQGLPQLTLSLSHTPIIGAAVVGNSALFRSVGVDIEACHRPIRDEVVQRISHPEDMEVSPMKLWCLKEAIFKCCMNTRLFEKNFEFSSIRIAQSHWYLEGHGLDGQWNLEEHQGHYVALAWIKI